VAGKPDEIPAPQELTAEELKLVSRCHMAGKPVPPCPRSGRDKAS